MNKTQESSIRAVLIKHVDAAVEEISENELLEFWWPTDFAVRIAEQALNSIALMDDSYSEGER